MTKSLIIGGFLIVTLASLLFVTQFSIDGIGGIGQCRIVENGDVCESYTKCIYEPIRDVSCIKGYEIITFPETQTVTGITQTGGSNE